MVIVFDSPYTDVYGQMALDDVLVSEQSLNKDNICRFFNWKGGPYATFGYAQFYSSAKRQLEPTGIKDFTRRPTGGGIVLHRSDLTFSLLFNCGADFKVKEVYDILHGLIKENFKKHNIDLDSFNNQSDYRPAPGGVNSNCFVNPVGGDLMSDGVKVLGGAMRRFDRRVLYQGSLQLNGARGNELFKSIIEEAFAKFTDSSDIKHLPLDEDIVKKAELLAVNRYSTEEWKGKF